MPRYKMANAPEQVAATFRVSERTRMKAEKILAKQGLSFSSALRLALAGMIQGRINPVFDETDTGPFTSRVTVLLHAKELERAQRLPAAKHLNTSDLMRGLVGAIAEGATAIGAAEIAPEPKKGRRAA